MILMMLALGLAQLGWPALLDPFTKRLVFPSYSRPDPDHPWKMLKDPFFNGDVKELWEISVEKIDAKMMEQLNNQKA